MDDKFEQRLGAVNARAKAARDQTEAAKAKQVAEREQKVRKAEEAIRDWNGRIAPFILKAVTAANQLITDTGLQLTTELDSSHIIWGGGAPGMPNLPLMIISVGVPKQRVSPAARSTTNRGAMPRSAVPNVQIGVNIDGTISITAPQGCKLSVPALMDASEVSEDKIKSVIADFVDMLVPESKWGLRDDIARERGTDERRKPVSLVSGAI